jgi:hypothetical protein
MIEPHPAQRGTGSPQHGFQHLVELLQVLADGQAQLAQTQQQLHGMVERIITAIEAQAKPKAEAPAPTPPIATYDDMYGPIPPSTPWVPPPVPPRRRHWLVRWLVQEARG